jgi:hypothetical protein
MEVKISFESGVGAMAKTTNPVMFGGLSLALFRDASKRARLER